MQKETGHGSELRFVIMDMVTQKNIGICYVQDQEVVGRIKTQMFIFLDGHMYFNNEVYKFRYDNMVNTKETNVSEDKFIDKYNGLIDFRQGEEFLSKMPIYCYQSHRQVYIVSN